MPATAYILYRWFEGFRLSFTVPLASIGCLAIALRCPRLKIWVPHSRALSSPHSSAATWSNAKASTQVAPGKIRDSYHLRRKTHASHKDRPWSSHMHLLATNFGDRCILLDLSSTKWRSAPPSVRSCLPAEALQRFISNRTAAPQANYQPIQPDPVGHGHVLLKVLSA